MTFTRSTLRADGCGVLGMGLSRQATAAVVVTVSREEQQHQRGSGSRPWKPQGEPGLAGWASRERHGRPNKRPSQGRGGSRQELQAGNHQSEP